MAENETEAQGAAGAGAAAEKSLLDKILDDGRLARERSEKNDLDAKSLVHEFVSRVMDKSMTIGHDTIASIQAEIAELDNQISVILNDVMHHEDFRKLEASWRGLHYLVMNSETSTMLKLRLLVASQNEVSDDLEKAIEFDQSVLFKKIYEEEYGTYGGHPYSFLIGDFQEFGRSPGDIATLEKMSGVAAAAHAPFIAAASPLLFDMDSFADLGKPRDLAKIFESTSLVKWQSFQASEDARYVTLVLPHILMRLPYGAKTSPVDGFGFEEDTKNMNDTATKEAFLEKLGERKEKNWEEFEKYRQNFAPSDDKYVWGNAAYALGVRITTAFAKYGWCAAIRGVEGGGLVEGLPAHTFKAADGDIALKCPTEVVITDRREKELDTLGFVSLVHCKGTDKAAFFGGQTTQKPKSYDTDAANANARLSARLPYILNASRFAHYLKVICRDKIGSFQTKDTLSQYLNRWIGGYVLGTDTAGQDLKAQYPLREARIDVMDVGGKPGAYKAVAFLRPHFQLEELTTSIRLVAELPPPAA